MNLSPQLSEALKRALMNSVVYTMLALGALLAVPESRNAWTILSVCLVTFFGPLGMRGYLEGTRDATRAAIGDVQPSDVGFAAPPVVRVPRPPLRRRGSDVPGEDEPPSRVARRPEG